MLRSVGAEMNLARPLAYFSCRSLLVLPQKSCRISQPNQPQSPTPPRVISPSSFAPFYDNYNWPPLPRSTFRKGFEEFSLRRRRRRRRRRFYGGRRKEGRKVVFEVTRRTYSRACIPHPASPRREVNFRIQGDLIGCRKGNRGKLSNS